MKRMTGLLLIIMLCFSLMAPTNVQAASTVRVTYNGVTKTYKNKKTYLYINNKKVKCAAVPIFMKSGAYMGVVPKIFKNSSLKVSVSSDSKTITMKYGTNTLRMTSGKKKAVLNGTSRTLAAAPMYATYTASGKKRWIVPLKSVCSALGISYQLSGGIIKIGGTTNSAPTTSAPTSHGEQIVLVLDAGHGGSDSGAVNTKKGLKEKNLNLAIVLNAKKYFDNDSKFKVYYTRTSDTFPRLYDRPAFANANNADLFISVHINSAGSTARGTETFYSASRNSVTAKNGVTSKEFATAMHNAVVRTTGFTNRGLKDGSGLAVLRLSNMPGCLLEYGFISNSTEATIMNANTARYGKELYEAVVDFAKAKNLY